MATKANIQALVIEMSGRQDLTETMYSGVTKFDFFLGAALKLLDLGQKTPETKRWLHKDIEVGDHILQFQNARTIHQVYMANSDGKYELERKTLTWINKYYSDPVADLETGKPLYYAPDVIHIAPQQRALTSVTYTNEFTYNYENILFGDSYGYNGIIWQPPTDEVYTVSMLADFYSLLEDDSDKNYWSIQYPNVLVQATLFAIEVFYRNSAGMQDYLNSLRPFLQGIDFDLAEQESKGLNYMRG